MNEKTGQAPTEGLTVSELRARLQELEARGLGGAPVYVYPSSVESAWPEPAIQAVEDWRCGGHGRVEFVKISAG